MGKYNRARFHVSVPGIHAREVLAERLQCIVQMLKNNGYADWNFATNKLGDKEYTFAMDSVPGSWCLDQDWLTFDSPAETAWNWVRPLILSDQEWQEFHAMASAGEIVVMVFRIEGDIITPHD